MRKCLRSLYKISFQKSAFLILLVSIALAVGSCDKQPPAAVESSHISDESSEEASSEVTSDESVAEQKKLYSELTLTSEDIPPAREDLVVKLIKDSDNHTLTHFLADYSGTFPVIADVVCTETESFACIVYEATRSEDDGGSYILYDWLQINTEDACFGESASEVPLPYEYEENANNLNGYFWIDYEPVTSGKACPYVVLYHEEDEDRTLFFEEEAKVYARIIRQNDDYAVLSLLEDSERSYLLIDREGNTISELEWVSDISVISPLMFGDDLLYCKMDSDEDYVYDTIGAIDMKTSEYHDIMFVGNSDYWSYFADGSGIVAYGGASPDATTLQYYSAAENELRSIEIGQPIKKLALADGILYGVTQGGRLIGFAWDQSTQELFMTDTFSAESKVVFGKTQFAVLHDDGIVVYTRIKNSD